MVCGGFGTLAARLPNVVWRVKSVFCFVNWRLTYGVICPVFYCSMSVCSMTCSRPSVVLVCPFMSRVKREPPSRWSDFYCIELCFETVS